MASQTVVQDDLSPAERRRRRVRDSIIGAAEEIFAEEGEAGLSMRRIAERIDYSPAALYKYFDSKEALFKEIREGFFERLLKRMQEVCDSIESGPMLCTACLRAYVETGLEQPGHYRLAFAGFSGEMDVAQDTYAFAASEHLRQMISESVQAGWFRDVDLDVASTSVWSSAHGLTILAVSIPDFPREKPGRRELELDELIDFHSEMMMRGLGAARLIGKLDAGERF
ncbi:helix-turn-helix transcriptional regulator [Alkalicaulis satelles]|uniref:Helix-turn-helix transcriptional regulator n=1 Tax=Alkalicaulis satelles TaxID=2609175 RepID=A0A5M6ZBF2_9PROT|nr:TetR/AcrR family transcriptional regulator [Alkalicaulis satelles]KAA5801665.1 helix-turn-helix transcriptional regulator [Alkalicaulis satelles]